MTYFEWDETTFLKKIEGSPVRRINHERWLRNIAVALGNAVRQTQGHTQKTLLRALQSRANHPSELVREHIDWAIGQQYAP